MLRKFLVLFGCWLVSSPIWAAVPMNTRVLTLHGELPIHQIQPGDRVLTPYGAKVVLSKLPVTSTVINLSTVKRTVGLLEDQEVMVVEKIGKIYKTDWTPVQLLRPGDLVVVMSEKPPVVVPGIRDLPGRAMHFVRRIFYPETRNVILPAYCTIEEVKSVERVKPALGYEIKLIGVKAYFAGGVLIKGD